ncbi:hypothetical protein MRB53_016100 [Persea americana]|uniref:Uncharacterized protein n=1 Tax=Persea americana TaxID=3435 RepID=A0ACC2M1D2_PERAE|nr:hypothetical protein MRB53_016100 [Persea americana]
MGWKVPEEKGDLNADGGDGVFIEGKMRFMIRDDLQISVVSSRESFTLLRELGISDTSVLEEMNVNVGEEELVLCPAALQLLCSAGVPASLCSRALCRLLSQFVVFSPAGLSLQVLLCFGIACCLEMAMSLLRALIYNSVLSDVFYHKKPSGVRFPAAKMLGRTSLSRSSSFRPKNLGQNALALIGNLCCTFFIIGVLIFTIIAATFEPEDPPFHPSTKITMFLTSTSDATFQSDVSILKTGEDFLASNQFIFDAFRKTIII